MHGRPRLHATLIPTPAPRLKAPARRLFFASKRSRVSCVLRRCPPIGTGGRLGLGTKAEIAVTELSPEHAGLALKLQPELGEDLLAEVCSNVVQAAYGDDVVVSDPGQLPCSSICSNSKTTQMPLLCQA